MTMYNSDRPTSAVSGREARQARVAAVKERVATNAIFEAFGGGTGKSDWSDASLAQRRKYTAEPGLPQAKRHVKSRNKFTSQRDANIAYGTLRASGKIERSKKGAKPGKRVRRIADENEQRNLG